MMCLPYRRRSSLAVGSGLRSWRRLPTGCIAPPSLGALECFSLDEHFQAGDGALPADPHASVIGIPGLILRNAGPEEPHDGEARSLLEDEVIHDGRLRGGQSSARQIDQTQAPAGIEHIDMRFEFRDAIHTRTE